MCILCAGQEIVVVFIYQPVVDQFHQIIQLYLPVTGKISNAD
jgi:hypothetical protein